MPARISQYTAEVVHAGDTDSNALLTQYTTEVLHAWATAAAPTGLFGAAVTHDVIEVVMTMTTAFAHVTQDVIEAVIVLDDPTGGGSGAGTVSFGYAV